jgi:hypothetical protein
MSSAVVLLDFNCNHTLQNERRSGTHQAWHALKTHDCQALHSPMAYTFMPTCMAWDSSRHMDCQ